MDFILKNQTEIRFGEGQIRSLRDLIPTGTKVLLLYGGGSIKANGVYQEVMDCLGKCTVIEFGGVEPNPVYETLQNAAEMARRGKAELILAVGGGSVADAAKFLSYMLTTRTDDPWQELANGKFPETNLPVGVVLTLPATGSESNPVSVITNRARKLKIPFANENARPAFAILDPSTMRSLDRRQLENGVVDAFTHVLEQYFTIETNAPIQYGYGETLMRVLIEWGPRLVNEPSREARENVMFAANQALNGLIGSGVPQDWSTHMIGHALTALYEIDHARTLTVIMPSLMRFKLVGKLRMLARYGRNVWNVTGANDEHVAVETIAKTEEFFEQMGCPVRLSQLPNLVIAADVVGHLERADQIALGEGKDIDADAVRDILKLAA